MNDGWFALGIVTMVLSATFVFTVIVMRRTIVHVAAQVLGSAAGATAGLGVGALSLDVFADRLDESDPWVGWVTVAAVLLVPLALANIGGRQAAAFARRQTPVPSLPVAPMHLEPGERVVWSTTASSVWLLVPGVAVLLLGPVLILTPDSPLWLVGVTVSAGIACLSLASIRVTADARGLRVKYGVLPWPTTDISVDRIESASVIDVRPMEWGGWGYRGTLTLMRQAAVVLRAGPGIRVDLADGRVFVVTVDDPETGVALLNAEIARLAG